MNQMNSKIDKVNTTIVHVTNIIWGLIAWATVLFSFLKNDNQLTSEKVIFIVVMWAFTRMMINASNSIVHMLGRLKKFMNT